MFQPLQGMAWLVLLRAKFFGLISSNRPKSTSRKKKKVANCKLDYNDDCRPTEYDPHYQNLFWYLKFTSQVYVQHSLWRNLFFLFFLVFFLLFFLLFFTLYLLFATALLIPSITSSIVVIVIYLLTCCGGSACFFSGLLILLSLNSLFFKIFFYMYIYFFDCSIPRLRPQDWGL